MGACFSGVDRQAQVQFEATRVPTEYAVLILGPPESGKSTVLNLMKIHYQGGFSDAELAEYRQVVYKNLLDSAHTVVSYMKKMGLECATVANRANANKILNYKLETDFTMPPPYSQDVSPHYYSDIYFSQDIALAISELCKDAVVSAIIDDCANDLCLMDSATYFFNEALRISALGYVPTETDVLKAHRKSVGLMATRLQAGPLPLQLFDVGDQWPERKKWIHRFESVTSIIFCTSLSEYDQISLENKNKMEESLKSFESIVTTPYFSRTSIILFFSKLDVFKNKLLKVPLEQHFREYTGGNDLSKAVKYILWKFMQQNHARLPVYPHLTHATDINDRASVLQVSAAVKETILQNALKDSKIRGLDGPPGIPVGIRRNPAIPAESRGIIAGRWSSQSAIPVGAYSTGMSFILLKYQE